MPLPKKIARKLAAAGVDPVKIAECGNCGCRSFHSRLTRGDGYADECMNEESYWNAGGKGPRTRCGCDDYAPKGDSGYAFSVVDDGRKIEFTEIRERLPGRLRLATSKPGRFVTVPDSCVSETPAEAVEKFVAKREAEIERLRGEIAAARETHRRWDR